MKSPISRRTLLRGVGAAISLPLLDAMLPRRAVSADAPPIRRLVALGMPNGRDKASWTPTLTGTAYDLPRSLQPLAPVQQHVRVLTGLASAPGSPGSHEVEVRAVFSEQTEHSVFGASLDVRAAAHLGGDTAIDMLTLCSEPASVCGSANCDGRANVSWSDGLTPTPREIDPAAVFARLFTTPSEEGYVASVSRRGGGSILDAVRADADALRLRLGADDRHRVDGYLEGIRAIEQRLATPALGCDTTWNRSAPTTAYEHILQMTDLIELAFACDRTRVVSFLMGVGGSYRRLREIGEFDHHTCSHQFPTLHAEYVRWYVDHFARLVDRLATTVGPDGVTLLDGTLVLFASGIGDGDSHALVDLPVLLAGGPALLPDLQGHVVFPDGTPIARLHLGLLRALGVDATSFGMDGDTPLPGMG